MFFDFGAGEFLGLAILAVILVGPERLPRVAADAAKIVRKVRALSHTATAELRENLGPGFEDLQPSDLNPKKFMKKQFSEVLSDEEDESAKMKPQIDPDIL